MIWGRSKWKSSPCEKHANWSYRLGLQKAKFAFVRSSLQLDESGSFAQHICCKPEKISCSIPGVQGKDHRYHIDTVVFCWKPMEILVRIYFINNFRVDYWFLMVFVWTSRVTMFNDPSRLGVEGFYPSKFTKPPKASGDPPNKKLLGRCNRFVFIFGRDPLTRPFRYSRPLFSYGCSTRWAPKTSYQCGEIRTKRNKTFREFCGENILYSYSTPMKIRKPRSFTAFLKPMRTEPF